MTLPRTLRTAFRPAFDAPCEVYSARLRTLLATSALLTIAAGLVALLVRAVSV